MKGKKAVKKRVQKKRRLSFTEESKSKRKPVKNQDIVAQNILVEPDTVSDVAEESDEYVVEESDEDIDMDSDSELQKAFASGKLQPGLNIPTEKPKEFINDVAGMDSALSKLEQSLPWVERLDVTIDMNKVKREPGHDIAENDANNDFKREMEIYSQAQAAVMEALPRLKQLGVASRRPDDYFAEMVKDEGHMKRIREKLTRKQQSLQRTEKARKLRDLKKYGKKVQQDVLQKRHKEKKSMMESVKRFRKGQESTLDFLDDDTASGHATAKKPRQQNATGTGQKHKVGKKREYKNKKFGFGGQKKRSKWNTAESSAETKSFPRKTQKNTTTKRLGKNRRQLMKNRKKR